TIIFMTGNPGLIEYYRAFLNHLHTTLTTSSNLAANFNIIGKSLIGFELSNSQSSNQRASWQKEAGLNHAPPFSLAEVIDAAERNVIDAEGEGDRLILVGHSVGAYICLEIAQRHRRRLEGGMDLREGEEPNIVGGICLFPTVVDIGESKQGVMLTKLSNLPFFQTVFPVLISAILTIIPTFILQTLVKVFTGFQPPSVAATTAFLKSKHGVQQALHMGADEMRTITTNKWDDEIWGAAHPSSSGIPRPKLFFYFGKRDHWVADRTRDDLLQLRGRSLDREGEEWKPNMEIDELGAPHAFVDAFSIPIAEKVREYVEEIVRA
ncbi:hypothetical protein EJ08DRAFT_549946, partial [Tothia fuscella]